MARGSASLDAIAFCGVLPAYNYIKLFVSVHLQVKWLIACWSYRKRVLDDTSLFQFIIWLILRQCRFKCVVVR